MNENQYPNARGAFGAYEQNVSIQRLVILPTGEYHDQFNRSFTTKMNNEILDRFNQRFSENREYGPTSFMGLTKDFLKYGAREEEPINIEHGWGVERCRFTLEVLSTNIMGLEVREYITGFTDLPDGITRRGLVEVGNLQGLVDVDPNLKFTINGIIDMHDQRVRTSVGMKTRRTMRSNVQLLSDPGYDGYSNSMEARIKPADIFYAMDGGLLTGAFGQNDVHDTRLLNTTEAKLSRRSNVIPTRYMSKIFDGYAKTLYADQTSHTDVGQGGSLYNQAAHLIREDNNSEGCFLKHLGRAMHSVSTPKSFLFRDLLKLDPTIQDRVEGRIASRGEKIRTHQLGDSLEWHVDDHETTAALMIAQSVSAIMSSMSIMFIDFSMSNMDQRGHFGMDDDIRPSFSIADVKLINYDPDMDQRKIVDAVDWRIWHEVVRDLTDAGGIGFELRVVCDLAGETVIHLGMDGQEPCPYVFPTFADSLVTPLLTHDLELPSAMARDFKTVLDTVIDRPSFEPDYASLDIESRRGYDRGGERERVADRPYFGNEMRSSFNDRDGLPSRDQHARYESLPGAGRRMAEDDEYRPLVNEHGDTFKY